MPVKLFVGGLSFSTSTERLRETFARFGGVDSAAVMTDRETGRSRGFGFVEMSSPEAAEQAIGALNGSSLDGRTIRVDKATPRGTGPRPVDRRPSPGGPQGGGQRTGGFADRRPPAGGGFMPRGGAERLGGWGGPPSGERAGRGDFFGEQRRGAGSGQRRGGGQRGAGGEQRRAGGPRRSQLPQRRSNDRGRRSLGDEGGYRPF